MTDWYETLFGAISPVRANEREPGNPPRRRNKNVAIEVPRLPAPPPPAGSVVGAMVGEQAEEIARDQRGFGPSGIQNFPVDQPPTIPQEEFDRADDMIAAMRRVQMRRPQINYAPRLPVMEGEQTAPVFPFGPDGVFGETPAARASRAVGVPDHYLNALIQQESGGNPNARARTSSATGLGQFIEQTWFNMMAQHGGRYGHQELQDAFERHPDGYYVLTRPELREDILNLRYDPLWSALMIAEYSRENGEILQRAIGRTPRDGEVYLAHFLGPEDAERVIRAAAEDGRRGGRGRPATQFVGAASVASNRTIFFDPSGRPRTAGQVLALQSQKFRGETFGLADRGF